MSKPESFPIDRIYVPVKRKKALKPELVHEIAESILEIGQQAPILVRPDESRFVLVKGLHRLEACKALGETTILGLLVSAETARQDGAVEKAASRKASCWETGRDSESWRADRLTFAERDRDQSEDPIKPVRPDRSHKAKNIVGMAHAPKA
jgi:hypothetical protein